MRTFIKIIAALVILAIATLIAIPFLIDPNDYKDEISEQVEKATGRQLTIQGDIGLSVFPWVALDLGQLSLSNAEGFESETFASVNAAQIRIKLLPLLKKEVEMDTIVLDGLMLNLETNEAGETNWDDLSKSAATELETETPATNENEDAAPALAALSIAGVKLSNANILWSDASKSQNYQIRNLNLDTDAIVPGSPADVSLNFDLISATPEVKAHITVDTRIDVDLENQQYALDNLQITTLAQSQDMPFSEANIEISADVAANMLREVISLSDVAIDGTVNTLSDQELVFKLTSLVSANLGTQQYQLQNITLDGSLEDPNMPGGKADFAMSTDVSADLEAQTLSIADLALQIEELVLNGQLNANAVLSEAPKFDGNLQIKPFNLRKLADQMDIELPEMADTSTLESFALTTEIAGSTDRISTNNLQAVLDQSNLTGQFGIQNFTAPAFTFDLLLDQIDVDRYLPPAKEAEKPATTASPASAAAGGATELPLETLRQINAKGTFKIGKLKVSGIHTENIVLTIDAKDGLIKMNPLQADLYEGQYRGNVNVDARDDNLKLSIDEKLEGIQAGPLLMDLIGDAKISGNANATIKLTGQGADVDAIKKTLNGQGNFAFKEGALQGINIAETLRRAKAALGGQLSAESSAPVATDFSTLSGSFTVNQGVISNEDLAMMSPLLRLSGAGKINLPEENLDYGLKVAVVGSLEGQGGRGLEDLSGLTIPVRISGSFDNPKPSVDLAALFKERATGEVRAKAEEKIREQLGDDIGGLLGGALLGGSESSKQEAAPANDENAATDETPAEEAPSAEEKLKEDVKNKLKGFF